VKYLVLELKLVVRLASVIVFTTVCILLWRAICALYIPCLHLSCVTVRRENC